MHSREHVCILRWKISRNGDYDLPQYFEGSTENDQRGTFRKICPWRQFPEYGRTRTGAFYRKSLTELMHGNLAVQMDGDLFKVILSFEEYQEDKKQ